MYTNVKTEDAENHFRDHHHAHPSVEEIILLVALCFALT